ncbi:MAG: response regulator [Mycobacteriales bacterium]
MTVRVLLADDHPVVRAGLRGMLSAEPDLEVVAEAGSGAEAVALAARHRPDVVLMDLRMPGVDGATATARIAAELPEVKVLVLTTYDTDSDIVRAVEAGATGYLLKDTPREQLAEAVRAAARGETVLAPPVAAKLMTRMRAPAPEAATLTARETEVLALVARGRTNADIGRELHISEATVKTHLIRIFAKLEVDDRTAAVTAALRRGLLPPD